jgi:hypothetical protein
LRGDEFLYFRGYFLVLRGALRILDFYLQARRFFPTPYAIMASLCSLSLDYLLSRFPYSRDQRGGQAVILSTTRQVITVQITLAIGSIKASFISFRVTASTDAVPLSHFAN